MLVNNYNCNNRIVEYPEYLMRFEDPGPNNCPQVIPENIGVNFENIKGIT